MNIRGPLFSFPPLVAAAAILMALLLPVRPAQAACTWTVAGGATLTFGTWQQAASGSETAIASLGDGTSGTGTYLFGTVAHGTVTIKNNPQCSGTMTLTVSDGGGAAGITLSNFQLIYNGSSITNGQTGITLPGNSLKTLLIGATATFTSAVAVGNYAPKFTVTATDSGTGRNGTTSPDASIGIDMPVTFTKISDVDFGIVSALTASTYRMSTSGVESVVSGAGQISGGTPTAASIMVKGSSTGTVTIQATGYTANNGVTPSNATCSYNGASALPCTSAITGAPPTAAGKTLLVGVDVAVDGTQNAGTSAAPSFSIQVNYQ